MQDKVHSACQEWLDLCPKGVGFQLSTQITKENNE